MQKRKLSRDANTLAAQIVAMSTGSESPALATEKEKPEKNPAAVALGRLGGLKGGKARADKLSKKRLSEIAKGAAKVKWKKYYDSGGSKLNK